MLAGLRGDRTVAEVCREHEISESLFYVRGASKLLEGGASASRARRSAPSSSSCAAQSRDSERALGRKTYELEIVGNGLRAWE